MGVDRANALPRELSEAWDRDGFFIVRNFGKPESLSAQHDRVVEIARSEAAGNDILPAYSLKEERLVSPDRKPEEQVSKSNTIHLASTVQSYLTRIICDLLHF